MILSIKNDAPVLEKLSLALILKSEMGYLALRKEME
jgi:hypothetical protein